MEVIWGNEMEVMGCNGSNAGLYVVIMR